jgi:hypothetical protein
LLPVKRVLTLSPEKVEVIFEKKLENEILVDIVRLVGHGYRVAEQGQAGQRKLVLICFVEKEAEVREHHPQFLPAVAVLELAQQVATHVVHNGLVDVVCAHTRVAVPAHVHGRVGSMLLLLLCLLIVAARRQLTLLVLAREIGLVVVLVLNTQNL